MCSGFEYKTKRSLEPSTNGKIQEVLTLPQLYMISFDIIMRMQNTQQHVRW